MHNDFTKCIIIGHTLLGFPARDRISMHTDGESELLLGHLSPDLLNLFTNF